jgi:DNA-binding NtrC family response regulator
MLMSRPTVLLASSDLPLTDAIRDAVESNLPFELEVVLGIDEVCRTILVHDSVFVVLVHLKKDDNAASVTRVLQTITLSRPHVVAIVIADKYHPEQALNLIRLGVADCLSRPLDLNRLGYLIDVLTLARRCGARLPAPEEEESTIERMEADDSPFLFINSDHIGRTIGLIRRIAPLDTTILLGGETGTGKTRLAGLIHHLSPRREKPFLTINCGALAANLVESEMFGHVRGAFTGADTDRVGKFAAVGGGTLLLDEIDTLSPALQTKLLRVVEERVFEPVGSNKTQPVHARLIVASNRPLEYEVAENRFRADLFYRLNVVAFNLPPLRERKDVIVPLARMFLQDFAQKGGRPVVGISDAALQMLLAYSWPGNVRELRNAIERAVAVCADSSITAGDLPETLHRPRTASAPVPEARSEIVDDPTPLPGPLVHSTERAEIKRIAQALARNDNNRLRAAAELGISRMTLYNKLHKYGLIGI